MAEKLQLHSFALAGALAPEQVPGSLQAFIKRCVPGLSKLQILYRARREGWTVVWSAKRSPQYSSGEIDAFEVDVTIDELQVQLIIRMRRVKQGITPARAPVLDPRQLSLF